jgi:ABC-type sugar transport system substrate-binding protein
MGLDDHAGRRLHDGGPGKVSGEDVGSEPLASLGEKRIRRSEFFSGAGRLAAAVGLGGGVGSALAGAATASALPPPSSKAAPGASKRAKKAACIEVTFSPFFTQIFQTPMAAYIKANKIPWSLTFGNENASIPTGIQLYNQYVADNYGLLILSTGDQMTTWESTIKKSVKQGVVFINHSTQAVSGATQNTFFSHKQSGVGVGNAAVAWAKKNNIAKPVVGILGNLSDPQGSKRTTWAWNTIKRKLPNAVLAGSVEAFTSAAVGASAAANLLAAHPDINIMISFATIAGVGAITSCAHAGKTDRNTFFLGCTDAEDATLKLIANQNSIMQANFGSFFAYSGILMIKDGIRAHAGKPIYPTRLIYGETITTAAQAKSFDTIAFNPLNPKYAYVYKKYFKYLDAVVGTGQTPPGQ